MFCNASELTFPFPVLEHCLHKWLGFFIEEKHCLELMVLNLPWCVLWNSKNLLTYEILIQPQAKSGNSVCIPSVTVCIMRHAVRKNLPLNWRELVLFLVFPCAFCVQNYRISDLLCTNLMLGLEQFLSRCHVPTFIKWTREFFLFAASTIDFCSTYCFLLVFLNSGYLPYWKSRVSFSKM